MKPITQTERRILGLVGQRMRSQIAFTPERTKLIVEDQRWTMLTMDDENNAAEMMKAVYASVLTSDSNLT